MNRLEPIYSFSHSKYIKQIAKNIFENLTIIHSHGYIHGDIKTQNILYNKIENVYILSDYETMQKPDDILLKNRSLNVYYIYYNIALGSDLNSKDKSILADLKAFFYTLYVLIEPSSKCIKYIHEYVKTLTMDIDETTDELLISEEINLKCEEMVHMRNTEINKYFSENTENSNMLKELYSLIHSNEIDTDKILALF